MRKSLWIAALLIAVVAPTAYADTFTNYTITFMGPAGTLFPASGSIVYDSTAGALNPFASFKVSWDGEVFDYTAIANQFDVAVNTASFSIQFTGGAYRIPYFADLECCTIPLPGVSARPGYDNGGGGLPLSIQDPLSTAVPEPGTAALMCAGIGLALLIRRRKTRPAFLA